MIFLKSVFKCQGFKNFRIILTFVSILPVFTNPKGVPYAPLTVRNRKINFCLCWFGFLKLPSLSEELGIALALPRQHSGGSHPPLRVDLCRGWQLGRERASFLREQFCCQPFEKITSAFGNMKVRPHSEIRTSPGKTSNFRNDNLKNQTFPPSGQARHITRAMTGFCTWLRFLPETKLNKHCRALEDGCWPPWTDEDIDVKEQ